MSLAKSVNLTSDRSNWMARLAPYRQTDGQRAVFEIIVTLLPFMAVWAAMWWLMQYSVLLSWLLAPLAAGLLVRLFIIQHDCGHSSMFTSSTVNNWVGRALGVLTLRYTKRRFLFIAGAGLLGLAALPFLPQPSTNMDVLERPGTPGTWSAMML